jgi:MOSC domain-containing protein YiiM
VPSILAINISEKKGVVKKDIEKGYFEVNHGLVGDAHAGNGHRQVSLLAQETIDKMRKLEIKGFCTNKFVENLTTEGIDIYKLPVGTKMEIGEALLEVTQVGKECHKGCEIRKLVGDCVMPREGIFVKVINAGWIKKGDEIKIL